MSSVNDKLRADFFFLFFAFQHDICIPVRMDRKCKNNPHRFSYISCNVVLLIKKITDFVKKAYRDYFEIKLGDQDKPFAPFVYCKACVENLRD